MPLVTEVQTCGRPIWPRLSEAEVKTDRKGRLSLRSEMHQRTRVRAAHVGELADVAERTYHQMRTLLNAAKTVGLGERFDIESTTWMRLDGVSHPQAHPRVITVDASGGPVGRRLDMVIDEEDAIWGFAVVELLRHTGIRIQA